MPVLELSHVSYQYPANPVLKDINLHVDEGEIVALLGGSGVGKTTLFNLIAGILPLQGGCISMAGHDDYRGHVSYMLQKDLLLEHKTVLANISLPLLLKGLSRPQAEAEARAVLEEFQLAAIEKKYPAELSGGMRQRVALIRTYLCRHKLFLLDEAFSALDAITKLKLHQWYRRIQQRYGLTTLLITHDIEEAVSLSQRIYLLNGKPGQIQAEIKIELPAGQDPNQLRLAYKRQILGLLDLET